MKKKVLAYALLLVFLLTLGAASTAFAAPKALDEFTPEYETEPLDWNDFWIKVGKEDINLLTYDVQAIVDASGKKPKAQTFYAEGVEWTDYVIKTREMTFYITPGNDYCYLAELTKKGITARGIQLGDMESTLLEVYPPPTKKEVDKKYTHYWFKVDGAPDELTPSDAENLNKLRPGYFYEFYARVNRKTQRVAALFIVSAYSY